MLKIQNLNKNFGCKQALHDVSLQISKPLIYGLIGPNGAGKTTLMRTICGILPVSSGTVSFEKGFSLQNIAYMPDSTALYTDMTVLDEIKYFGHLRGLSANDAFNCAVNNLNRLGLMQYLKTPVERLSKGTIRKLQFICTFLVRPILAILDEPFSGLDPISAIEVEKIIFEMKSQGVAIFLSTHHMEQAERFCDHIFLINQGSLLIDDDMEHLKLVNLKDEYLIESFAPINFLSSQILSQQFANGFFRYRIIIGPTYSYSQLMQDIGQSELLSLSRLAPSLKEIFVKSVKNL